MRCRAHITLHADGMLFVHWISSSVHRLNFVGGDGNGFHDRAAAAGVVFNADYACFSGANWFFGPFGHGATARAFGVGNGKGGASGVSESEFANAVAFVWNVSEIHFHFICMEYGSVL